MPVDIRRTQSTLAAGIILACLLAAGCASVVNHAAFFPDRTSEVSEDALPAGVRRVFVPTADGERLEAFIVTPEHAAMKLVIYFHGNAGNIAQRLSELERLARSTHAIVLGVGYRGYGSSTGKPSERGIYRDGEAAWRYANEELEFTDKQIVLCGVSLGSAVAVNTAMDRQLGGVILVTPMTSAREFAREHGHGGIAWLAGGAFDSLAKAPRLRSPALVIHGTRDEVIPFEMGRRLFAAIPTAKRFVAIDGARHNDVAVVDPAKYWAEIAEFVNGQISQTPGA